MSTAAARWIPGRIAVRRTGGGKAPRDAGSRTPVEGQLATIGFSDFEDLRVPRCARTARGPLAHAESALFALVLGAVGYLWLAQATGGF